MSNGHEVDRRRALAERRETDRERWSDPRQLAPAWDARAGLAAAYIPRGSRVLDLGCGAMALERSLPLGCAYIPSDLVARDERTIVCDFNAGEYPASNCDVIVALGVLEYLIDAPAFLAWIRATGKPAVISYSLADGEGPADRRALGWMNDYTADALNRLIIGAGFAKAHGQRIMNGQILLRLEPTFVLPRPEKSVWAISYSNTGNFGDRLGVQLLSQVMPPHAVVRHIHHVPFDAPPEGEPDLLVVGIGNSMFSSLLTDEFAQLLTRARRVVGIFGTQYREAIPPNRFRFLMEKLDVWFARSEEDLALYGGMTRDPRHLGDWLIDAFPMARPDKEGPVDLGGMLSLDAPLDRYIEYIQRYRCVRSGHMHPLLCALTSAEEVIYSEQPDLVHGKTLLSGKFRSLLLDIFGREYPADVPFRVDRAAVVNYKTKVRANIADLRKEMARLVG